MKGLIFTEFVDMVEHTFGEDLMEQLIEETDLSSGGSYTSVGLYDATELMALVQGLSVKAGVPVPDLVRTFGRHLGRTFTEKHTAFFREAASTLDVVRAIDNHIHKEVLKLYPDAELPKFWFDDSDPELFILYYESTRGLADLATGLIEATAAYYNESFIIEREDSIEGPMHRSRFTLRKRAT